MSRIFPLAAALAFTSLACLLSGCGGSKPADKQATAPPAAKPAAAAKGVVDNRPVAERLDGEWVGALVVDVEGVKNLAPEQIEAAKKQRLGIAFAKNGVMAQWDATDYNSPDVMGTWKLVKQEGDNITIQQTSAGGEPRDVVLLFETPDSFLIPLKTEVANLGAMRFERLR
jgi:hypothetical protein